MKKPNSITVLAFLKSKKWTIEKKDEMYAVMKPPTEIKFENEFRYKIPINEKAIDYKEYMTRIIFSIAQLYQLDKLELLFLLSKSLSDLQKEVETFQKDIDFRKILIASAS